MHSERTWSGQKLGQVIFQLDMRGGKEKTKPEYDKLKEAMELLFLEVFITCLGQVLGSMV